jgi:hypothetical protein
MPVTERLGKSTAFKLWQFGAAINRRFPPRAKRNLETGR